MAELTGEKNGALCRFCGEPFPHALLGERGIFLPPFSVPAGRPLFFLRQLFAPRKGFPLVVGPACLAVPVSLTAQPLAGAMGGVHPFSSSFSLPAHVAANRLKRLVADHMLHPAGVLGGGLPVNAQAHEQIGQDSMPLVNFKSEFAPCFR